MTEHPLPLPDDMVRALDVGKTQHRLPMELTAKQREAVDKQSRESYREYPQVLKYCPFGAPGDILVPLTTWVAEPARGVGMKSLLALDLLNSTKPTRLPCNVTIRTSLDLGRGEDFHPLLVRRPGFHLPTKFRHLLPRFPVKRVWVERLQDISEADAIAEGIEPPPDYATQGYTIPGVADKFYLNCQHAYRDLWDSIYAAKCPWTDNPWVWACEFEVKQ